MRAELILDCKNEHGEGIFWNPTDGFIWWTDIEGKALHSYDPLTHRTISHSMPDRVCCFAPRASGGFIIAYADRVILYNLDTKTETLVTSFEKNNHETRLNDGRTDRQGRFVVGGMNEVSGKADSSVIRINADLSVQTIIEKVSCANSTCFSPDGTTMFFSDTPTKEIVAFDYNIENGSLSNKRLHASFANEPGLPDGSCVDAEGGVWNAEWEGRRVVRMAPNGTIDQVIEVPVWKPTCCAFGGPNLDTLFITTSRFMSDEATIIKEPSSGGIFAVKPGIQGVIDTPFKG
ncbi:SMP-30/gluconolactonase/LRE family protein [Amylibacter sp.]|mgnify:FL=1|jgi:L-arabinonolactonase|nr:SMP-30/gluconolactonase/LRE family protein [Amylibacter sp.]MDA9293558.1 SMP-30/gluconolactonase/LRE family protein [Amylibacter sp.]MDB9817033.1 SMP-30/gluconolactonase/LRE family protein [Amylibacter sp.]